MNEATTQAIDRSQAGEVMDLEISINPAVDQYKITTNMTEAPKNVNQDRRDGNADIKVPKSMKWTFQQVQL